MKQKTLLDGIMRVELSSLLELSDSVQDVVSTVTVKPSTLTSAAAGQHTAFTPEEQLKEREAASSALRIASSSNLRR